MKAAALLPIMLVAMSSGVAFGSPTQTFTLAASFTPNELGVSTNLSMIMALTQSAGTGIPNPVSDLVAYGPPGIGLDLQGVATCERMRLELNGPTGCPAQSRVGFGGGVGAVEFAGAPVKEPYTLDFFLAPREHGHLTILVYVSALNPVPVELVLTAREVHGSKPYGFGLAVAVPPVDTIPGAANASAESGYVSLGGADIAYYKTIRGKRKLVHIKGLVAPTTCPGGGFPFAATVTFEDGATSTGTYSSPCPAKRR